MYIENMPQRCSINECEGVTVGRGWCRKHYQRWWKAGDPLKTTEQKLCSVDGCGQKHYGRGLCRKHYMWLRKYGSIENPQPSLADRLLARRTITQSGCWVWTGKLNRFGYGMMEVDGREKLVHRTAYELWVGPIPSNCEIDHVVKRGCASTACFNPVHLEAVSQYVNNMRSKSPASLNAKKTECKHGHPFDAANTYYHRKGRQCRTCAREYQTRRRASIRGT